MTDNNNLNNVQDGIKYSTEQFDKNILFIASGALGVSFAFIKDVVTDLDKAQGKEYLINSWYIFSSVIFLSLIAHYVAMQAGKWAIKNDDLNYDTYNKKIRWWNIPIQMLNIASIILILIGAISLIYFINRNI